MEFAKGLFVLGFAAAIFSGPLEDLKPGEWYEVPNSHMSALDPCPARGCAWSGSTGQMSVIDAWSGGAFDTKRDRLIIWGGGHTNYGGNEVYVFDLPTLKWLRLTDPAPDVSGTVGMSEYPPYNGLIEPRSRHTYNYIQYVPSIDRFCSFGYSAPYLDGGPGGNQMHAFNFDLNKWERKVSSRGYGLNAMSAYDPVTGHGWVKGTDSHSWLCEFLPESTTYGKWVNRTTDSADFYYKYATTMDIDPVARKLVAVGGGEVWYWDISTPAKGVTQTLVTTAGATGAVSANDPGMAYDPVTGKILAWSSGQTIYSLDVPTKTWTQVSGSGANPGSPSVQGTYGRFRYSPAHNVFMVVNSVSQNVFFYKHTAGNSFVEAQEIHKSAVLFQATPNPFSRSTQFNVHLDRAAKPVTLRIYDTQGRLVKEVLRNAMVNNDCSVRWSPKANAAGTFIACLSSGGRTFSRKLLFVP